MFTTRRFHEIEALHEEFLALASRVERGLEQAVRALLERDSSRAAEAAAGEAEVDEADNRIGARCHRILLLFQPVAHDLRRVLAVSRMTIGLERIGDYAVRIAGRAQALAALPPFAVPVGLTELAAGAVEMVHAAVDAYARVDARAARRVCGRHAELRRLSGAVTEQLIAAMKAAPEAIESAVCLLSVVESLDRIAGHATNIAEDDVFLAEDLSIRHHWDEECLALTK